MDKDVSPPAVAFVIEELSVGGAEHMLIVLANEMHARGWRVSMVCLRSAGELSDRLHADIQVEVLNKKAGVDPALPARFSRVIRQLSPDIINSHLWVANTWTRLSLLLSRRLIVISEHSRDSWKPQYYRWIDRILDYRTRALVAVSRDTGAFYNQDIGIAQHKIHVINNGIDTARFAVGDGQLVRDRWLRNEGLKGDKPTFIIGTAGRLVGAKNHRRLIDAVALLHADPELQHQPVHCFIVGEGVEHAALQHYINTMALQQCITLVGARSDMPDVMAALDLFVLSSDREGHPLTVLEAQTAGTPVVLTDAGGCRDAVAVEGEHHGGLLVEKSAEALAQGIKRMMLNSDYRQQCADFARRFALQHFDRKQMVDRYERLFRRVMHVKSEATIQD